MRRPLGRRVRVLLATYTLSCVGTGLIYPFTALYLVQMRQLGAGTAGVYFVVIALTSFAWAPVAGRLVDALSPAKVSAFGVLLQAAGYAALAAAVTPQISAACAVLIGLGNGTFYPGFTPVMASLLDKDQRKRGFSTRYLAMNLGLGVGAAIAGPVIDVTRTTTSVAVLYLTDALTFLPFAIALYALGRRATAAAKPDGERASYRLLLRHRRLLILLATQTLLVVFGYSQIDTAVPLVLVQKLGLTTSVVGLVIAVNTAAVVVLQAPLTRWLERYPSPVVLSGAPAVWAIAAGLGVVAAFLPQAVRIGLMLGYAVAFAVGEACYAGSYQPLLTELTPASALGRGTALSSLSWNAGSMAGPALSIAVVGLVSPQAYWTAYGLVLLAAGMLALSLRERPVPREARADANSALGND